MLKNFTLLYVEDDKDTQEQMKMVLEDDVKEFIQAYNGKEGLELYKKKNPDIVLTDINMPQMDGLDMASEIKKIDKYKPIIVMSAFDDRSTLLRAIEAGIDYFTPKPIDIDILFDKLDIISQHLQNELDIKEMRKKELDTLYNLAHYDTLTQIPNRMLFNIKLDQAISKANRDNSMFALFFIDLDNFKTINDTYGHASGDEVLKAVTNSIKKVIRVEDTFARISGDEFSLIVEGIKDVSCIDSLANKILKATATTINFQENSINMSCSIGISIFPKDATNKEELLHIADSSMYEAKRAKKGSYNIYSSKN